MGTSLEILLYSRKQTVFVSGQKTLPKTNRAIFSNGYIGEQTQNSSVISEFLYHATYRPLLQSIKINGLGNTDKTYWEDSVPGTVYMTADPYAAQSYAQTCESCPQEWTEDIVILKINTDSLDKDKLTIDRNIIDNSGESYEYHGVIPWRNIQIYEHQIYQSLFEKQLKIILQQQNINQLSFQKIDMNDRKQFDKLIQGAKLVAKASGTENPTDKGVLDKINYRLNEGIKYYFILNKERIIGFCCFGTYGKQDIDKIMIDQFCIYPEFQGKHLGQSTLKWLIDYLKQEYPDCGIQIYVMKINVRAFNLYKKLGFQVTEQFDTGYHMELKTISDAVKNNIKDDLVYHASPLKLDILSGNRTGSWSGQQGNVFITPCKGIAACFLINKQDILKQLYRQFNCQHIENLNFGYDIWDRPVIELYEIPEKITVLLNLPGINEFSGISYGYIYTIDYSEYSNKTHMFNKNKNSDVQFLIEGDVKYVKCEKVSVRWTCRSSEQCIERHGEAVIPYDPPYNYKQTVRTHGKETVDRLLKSPEHKWRMETGIELLHKQPTLQQQIRTYKNQLKMTPQQKKISDEKSIQLFGIDNLTHYKQILKNDWKV